MRRRTALPLLVLLAALGCGSSEGQRADHLAKAEAYQKEQKLPEALIELKNALALAPEDAGINFRIAELLVAQRDLRNALFYYREARRLDPNRIEAYLAEATLLRAADPNEAANVVNAALELQPGNAAGHRLLAELALDRADFDAALAAALRSVELAPADPAGHFEVGRIHLSRIAKAVGGGETASAADCQAALGAFERAGERAESQNRWRSQTLMARALGACPDRQAEAAPAFRAAVDAAQARGPRAVVTAATAALEHAREARDWEARRWALERIVAADASQIAAWIELAAVEQQAGGSADAVYRRMLDAGPADPEARLAFARFLLSTDRTDQAVAALEAAIAAGVEPARMLATLVSVDYATGRGEAAAAAVERMERDHPGNPFTELARAERMLQEGRLDEASGAIARLVGVHENADARHLQAVVGFRRNQLADAKAAIDRAVELEPREARHRALRARIQAATEDWSSVLDDLRWIASRARRLTPPERLLLARTYYETDREPQGRELLDGLTAEPEPFLPALVERARRETARDPTRARAALERAHAIAPTHPEVLARLAALDLADGNRARALERLDAAIEQAPASVDARLTRARLLAADGKLEPATADARAAFEAAPHRADAALLLIQVLGQQGQEQAALAALEAQQAAGRLSPPVQVLLARLCNQLGQGGRAIELLELAIAARADLPLAKSDLAYLLAERGEQLDRSQQLASEALAALPDDHRVLHTLGYIHLRRGQSDLALPRLEGAIARARTAGEESAIYYYHLGLALRGARRNRSAVEAFDRALALDPELPQAAIARREREAALAGAPPPASLF
jgi:tetratricopeptide (TPR) repeat protein